MRLVHWCDAYWPIIGGTEVASVRLLTALRSRGHVPLVITDRHDSGLPERDVHERIIIHRLPFRQAVESREPSDFFNTLQRALDIVRDFEPDVAHLASIGPAALFCAQVKTRLRLPLVLTHQMSGMWTEEVGPDHLLQRAASSADWVVFPSQSMRDEAEKVGVSPVRNSVIHNGIEVFASPQAPLPWDPPLLLALGRLSPEKGFDVFLKALALLRDEGVTFHAVLAGDGPDRASLEAAARRKDLDALSFVGWVRPQAVPDLLSSATIVVVPSRDESFGLVALEAQMAGRPVAATAVGGLTEIVRDGETGVLVPPDDPRALADALTTMLSDRSNLQKMGRRARTRAEDLFSIAAQIERYERLFETITEGRDD